MSRQNARGLIITILFAILILILSIMPTEINDQTPSFYFPGLDKIVHAIMYGSFSFLVLIQYLKQKHYNTTGIIFILGLVWFYSILMEILQLFFIDFRSGEWKDVIANLVGVILGALTTFLWRRIRS